MAQSAEQQVLEALRSDLEAVTVANGFNFDTQAVLFFSELPQNLGVDRLVTVEAIETRPSPPGQQPTGKHAKRLTVDVFVTLRGYFDDATAEEKIGEALADIEKRVLVQPFLSGKSTNVTLGEAERFHTPEQDARQAARLRMFIDYRHTYGDPYDLST